MDTPKISEVSRVASRAGIGLDAILPPMLLLPLETAPQPDIFVSGTFWLTVIIVVLTLGLIVIGLLTLRREKKVLEWSASVVPMLTKDSRIQEDVAVSWHGVSVEQPTLVAMSLRSAGNKDIPSSDFSGGQPIRIEFDNIISLLEPAEDERDGILPIQIDGNAVLIGPGLFKKSHRVDITVLAKGDAFPRVAEPPLTDVTVRENKDFDIPRWRSVLTSALALSGASSGAIVLVLLKLVFR